MTLGEAKSEVLKLLDETKPVSYTHLDVYKRQGEMRPNGSKGRGFAVGAPARRSRDGNGKIAAPVGPMTGQRGFAAGEMEGE